MFCQRGFIWMVTLLDFVNIDFYAEWKSAFPGFLAFLGSGFRLIALFWVIAIWPFSHPLISVITEWCHPSPLPPHPSWAYAANWKTWKYLISVSVQTTVVSDLWTMWLSIWKQKALVNVDLIAHSLFTKFLTLMREYLASQLLLVPHHNPQSQDVNTVLQTI